MNQVTTVACKLQVPLKFVAEIDQTLDVFAAACEWIKGNTPENLTNKTKMQSLIYKLEPIATQEVLGVDLGRTDLAYTSDKDNWNGQQLNNKRNHYAWLRLILQKKASKGTLISRRRCRQLLARLSGKEKQFQKQINHEISRQLVNKAVASKRAISLEDLTGIRERTNEQPRSKQERRRSNSWAFYELRQFLTYKYKCLLAGVPLILVNPAYRSQSCHKCLHIGNRSGKSLRCVNPDCKWFGDADYNGTKNLAALGRTINTSVGSGLACKLTPGVVKYLQLNLFGDGSGLLKTLPSAIAG